jgi:hypothetical protein
MMYDWDGPLSRRKIILRMSITALTTILAALLLAALLYNSLLSMP